MKNLLRGSSLIIIFYLCFCGSVFSQSELLDIRFSLKQTDRPINDVILEIAKATNTSIVFNSSLIPVTERMTLNVTDKTIGEVFTLLFSHYNIDFIESNGFVIVKKRKGETTIFKEEKAVIKIDDQLITQVEEKPIAPKIEEKKKEDVPDIIPTKTEKPEIIEKKVEPIEPKLDLEEDQLIEPIKTESPSPVLKPVEKKEIIQPEIIEDIIKLEDETELEVKEEPTVAKAMVDKEKVELPMEPKEPTKEIELIKERHLSISLKGYYLAPISKEYQTEQGGVNFTQSLSRSFNLEPTISYNLNRFDFNLGVSISNYKNSLSSTFYSDVITSYDSVFVIGSFVYDIIEPPAHEEIVLIKDSILITDTSSVFNSESAVTTYQYLEIPISVNFSFVQGDKWLVGILLGANMSVLLKREGTSLNDSGELETDLSSTSSNTFISLKSGMNVTYLINKKWSVIANVTNLKGLQPMLYGDFIPASTADYLGGGVEIKYKF